MSRSTLLIEDIDEFLPIHSVWDTVGGSDELATVVFLRGSILSSYGYVETQLNDLALRASHVPALHALSPKLPQTIRLRMSFLKTCFETFEPLAPCREHGAALIDEFLAAQPDRNEWAHGRLVAMPGTADNRWLGANITLEYCSPKREVFQVGYRRMSATDLTLHAKKTRALAQRSQELHFEAAEVLPKH